ncbi:MAG: type IV secretion system DNA-binding domain-containing protein [Terracidiphilus sp.]
MGRVPALNVMSFAVTSYFRNRQADDFTCRAVTLSASGSGLATARAGYSSPNNNEQIAALQPLFRALARIAVFAALSLPEKDNGLWFCIDDFDALGRLEGLQDAMVRFRKHGGRVILSLQIIAMIETLSALRGCYRRKCRQSAHPELQQRQRRKGQQEMGPGSPSDSAKCAAS